MDFARKFLFLDENKIFGRTQIICILSELFNDVILFSSDGILTIVSQKVTSKFTLLVSDQCVLLIFQYSPVMSLANDKGAPEVCEEKNALEVYLLSSASLKLSISLNIYLFKILHSKT